MALKGTKPQQKIKRLRQKSDQNQNIYFTLFSFRWHSDNSDMFTSYVSRSRYSTFVRHFAFFLTVIPHFRPRFLLLPTLLCDTFSSIFDNGYHWIKIMRELLRKPTTERFTGYNSLTLVFGTMPIG